MATRALFENVWRGMEIVVDMVDKKGQESKPQLLVHVYSTGVLLVPCGQVPSYFFYLKEEL